MPIRHKRSQRRHKNHIEIYDFCVFFCDLCGEFLSVFQLDGKLDLSWVEDIARSTEPGSRRQVYIGSTVERVDVPDVNSVEEIEEIEAEFAAESFRKFDRSRDTHINRGKARTKQRVASKSPRTIRKRVAVTVGVESGKDGEGSSALYRHQRTELEIPQPGHALRHLLE